MTVLGITGGIGSGKSRVLQYLEEGWHAEVYRLDDISRSLLLPGGACYEETIRLFGEGIVLEDGTLDRQRIAELIFQKEELRASLDALVHPAVKEETLLKIGSARRRGVKLVVIEAALLIEDHYDAFCDEMWYIYADAGTRYRRLAETRGYSGERIRATMARQLSEEEFRRNTQVTIDNNGAWEDTEKQIDARLTEIFG